MDVFATSLTYALQISYWTKIDASVCAQFLHARIRSSTRTPRPALAIAKIDYAPITIFLTSRPANVNAKSLSRAQVNTNGTMLAAFVSAQMRKVAKENSTGTPKPALVSAQEILTLALVTKSLTPILASVFVNNLSRAQATTNGTTVPACVNAHSALITLTYTQILALVYSKT